MKVLFTVALPNAPCESIIEEEFEFAFDEAFLTIETAFEQWKDAHIRSNWSIVED